MADFDPNSYTITIKRVTTDGERLFRAIVAELPDVGAYSETYEEAYNLTIDAIRSLHKIHMEKGWAFPEVHEDEETFSGRVTLRMGTTLHRKAAMVAEREGVSLNLFIVTTIAARVGAATSIAPSAHVTGSPSWIAQGGPVVGVGALSGSAVQAFGQFFHIAGTSLMTERHLEWAPPVAAEANLMKVLSTTEAVMTERQPFVRKPDITHPRRPSGERRSMKVNR